MLSAKNIAKGTVILTITGYIPSTYAHPGPPIKPFALIIVAATDKAIGIHGIDLPAKK